MKKKRLRKRLQKIKSPPAKKKVLQRIKIKSKAIFGRLLIVLTFVGTLFAIPQIIDYVKDKSKTQEVRFRENNFIKGILYPDKVQNEFNEVSFDFGNFKLGVPLSALRTGILLRPPGIACFDSTGKHYEIPIKLALRLEGDRIQVSDSLIELSSRKLAGVISDNQWLLIKDNILSYHANDKFLEVLDKKGPYVIFRMEYLSQNIISVRGYFVGRYCIMVANGKGISIVVDENDAELGIKQLKPYYDLDGNRIDYELQPVE
jgi:hypothetical protein